MKPGGGQQDLGLALKEAAHTRYSQSLSQPKIVEIEIFHNPDDCPSQLFHVEMKLEQNIP